MTLLAPAPGSPLILAARLAAQRLSGPPAASPAQAVTGLLAVQAQDHIPGLWSVSLRTAHSPLSQVQAALDAGDIVRVHVLRPTWHLVAAADLGWLQAITGPRVRARNASFYARLGMDEDMMARSRRLIRRALSGRNELTMAQIGAALEAGGMELGELHLVHYVMDLELRGEVCSGPRHGKQHSYMLAAGRLGEYAVPDDEECLRRLALRYFAGHGPATLKDLQVWSSMTLARLRPAVESLRGELECFEEDGRTYYSCPPPVSPAHERGPARGGGQVPGAATWLLQQFDEIGIGYRESRDVLGAAWPATIGQAPATASYYNPIVTGAGMAGWWRARAGRSTVAFDITESVPGVIDPGALAAAQERYRAFRLG